MAAALLEQQDERLSAQERASSCAHQSKSSVLRGCCARRSTKAALTEEKFAFCVTDFSFKLFLFKTKKKDYTILFAYFYEKLSFHLTFKVDFFY